jgi:hypothetical protein
MTIVNTNFVFTATSESVVTFGRTLTTEERAGLQAKRGAMMSQGKFGSFPLLVDGVQIYQWLAAEAATEWVAYCNTFTPPPTSAVVRDIPEPTPPADTVAP